jgi:hypothetical protein
MIQIKVIAPIVLVGVVAAAPLLSGRIINPSSGSGLMMVKVKLKSSGDSAFTDATGAYAIQPAGASSSSVMSSSSSNGTTALVSHKNWTARIQTSALILNLSSGTNVRVEILDASGRTLERIHSGILSQGEHSLALKASSGKAYVRIQTDNHQEMIPIVFANSGTAIGSTKPTVASLIGSDTLLVTEYTTGLMFKIPVVAGTQTLDFSAVLRSYSGVFTGDALGGIYLGIGTGRFIPQYQTVVTGNTFSLTTWSQSKGEILNAVVGPNDVAGVSYPTGSDSKMFVDTVSHVEFSPFTITWEIPK